MKNTDIDRALDGHPNADAIRDVLERPTESYDSPERKAGLVVGQGEIVPDTGPSDGLGTVHRMAHWQGGFNAEEHARHHARQSDKRARHGLQFLERPHRKGRYIKTTPSARRKVMKAFKAQCLAESKGEDWQP